MCEGYQQQCCGYRLWWNLCGNFCGGIICSCCCGAIWLCRDKEDSQGFGLPEDVGCCICQNDISPGFGCNLCCFGCNINPDMFLYKWTKMRQFRKQRG